MRARRLCVAVLTLFSLLAAALPLPAIAVAASRTVVTLTPEADTAAGGQAGLDVALSSLASGAPGERLSGYQFTLTPGSPSALQILDANCPPAFAACTSHTDQASGVLTVFVSGAAGAPTPAELAFVSLRITSPVTALTTVTLTFQQLTGQAGAALPLPAPVTVVLQRGAVLNVGSQPPSVARTLSHQDVTSALEYLVGSLPAGAGQGQVNPVNLASLVPDGSSAPDVPGPANVVALLQYLAGERGADLGPATSTVAVVASVSNPSTTGFTLMLSPPVPGLTAGDLSLPGGAQVQSLTTRDGGATYAVAASLAAGQSYTLTLSASGYSFSASLTVAVPQTVATAVYAAVGGVSVNGFTLSLSPPVPDLAPGDLSLSGGARVTSLSTSDHGATYAVTAALTSGQSYGLTLSTAGYSFTTQPTVTVPGQTVATAVYASVYGASTGGFTLDLTPPVPDLAPGDLSLSGGAQVTSLSTSDHGATYAVAAALTPGQSYALTISAAGYTFTAQPMVTVPGQTVATAVYASVSGASTGGFKLDLGPPVDGLSPGDLRLSGGAPVNALSTSDGGATYAVGATLTPGASYTLTITANGYTFNTPTVAVPVETVDATVSAVSTGGLTVTLDPPVDLLGTGNVSLSGGAQVTSFDTSDHGATYAVRATLTPGASYNLTIRTNGYTFNTPTVAVPVEAVQATVSNVSTSALTVTLNPPVDLLGTGNVTLSGGATPISFDTFDNGATYVLDAAMAPGTDYTLLIVAAAYTFNTPTVAVPVEAVDATVSDVSTGGLTVTLNPPVDQLGTANVSLSGGAQVTSFRASDQGATYAVSATLTPGASYTLTITANGYTFNSPMVAVPVEAVHATVSDVSTGGLTVALNPPVDLLGSANVTLSGGTTPISFDTSDEGATYVLDASLAPGTDYTLTITAGGYTFNTPTVAVPVEAVDATVSDVSTGGLTVTLNPPVPGLTTGNVGLTSGAQVTSFGTSDHGATYTLGASLTAGTTYTLTLTANGYTFNAPTVAPAVAVTSAVYNPTSSGFTLQLSEPVPGLTPGDMTLTDSQGQLPLSITSVAESADGGATYTLAAALTMGQTYTLTFGAVTGYAIFSPPPFIGVAAPEASTTGDTEIVLDFGTAMAAPPPVPAGFTVTNDGSPDTVTAVSLDSNPQSLDLTVAVPAYQNVTVSYAGTAGVATAGGVAWPSFSDAPVTTPVAAAITQAQALLAQGHPADQVAAFLLQGYSYSAAVTAIALVATFPSDTYTDVAQLLAPLGQTQNLPTALPAAFPPTVMTQAQYVTLLAGSPYYTPINAIGSGLKTAYGDTDAQAASALKPSFDAHDVALLLDEVYADGDAQVAAALTQAGYLPTDVATALQTIFGDGESRVAYLLRAAGDSWSDVDSTLATAYGVQTAQTFVGVLYPTFGVQDVATALDAEGMPDGVTATALGGVGAPLGDVVAALVAVYRLSPAMAAQEVSPFATTAPALLAALELGGLTGLSNETQALFATAYDASSAASALVAVPFAAGDIGPALTTAGYGLQSAVAALVSLNGGGDTDAVIAAWPGLFGSGALAAASTSAANMHASGYAVLEAAGLLEAVYPDVAHDPTQLAAALFAPYGPYQTALALQAWYEGNGAGAQADQGTADALYPQYAASCLVSQLNTCLGNLVGVVHAVFGDGAVAMSTILQDAVIRASDPITVLAQAVCTGTCYSANDVAGAALQAEGFQTALAASVLHEAGYTAAQVATALQSTLGASGFTVAGVTTVLSGGDTANADKYTAADIAGVLMSDFSATAATTAAALLAPNLPYSLADVASALQTVYGIDGAGFVQILEGIYTNTQLLAMLPNTAGCSFSVVCVLKSQTAYGLTAAEAAAALHSAGTLADGTLQAAALDVLSGYSLGPTSPATSATRLDTQASTLIQAGYSITEIVTIFAGEGEDVSTALTALKGAGAGITATDEAAYLQSSNHETDSGTAGALQQAGYTLNDIVTALISVYNDVSNLETILPSLGYGPTSIINSTIAAVSPDPALDVALAMAGVDDPAPQVVSALQDLFPTLGATAIAATLGTSGANYAPAQALGALRAEAGLTASQAETLLEPDFNVTGITAVAAALVGARYSPAEVAGALGSTNPVDISTALAAASVPAVYIQSALVDAFGPSGSLHDPLALADDLKALGFDPIAAGRALQALGLDPAHVGALLFVDGYSLADVATGILDALPASTATSGSWDHAVMGALRQIPSISGAGGFTTTDAAQALQALIGTTCDSSCMAEIGRAMFSAGYSASDVAGVLYSTYHEPLSQTYFDEPVGGLGYDLQVAGFTSVQVAQAEQAAPIGATDVQIAGSLLATTFNDGDCYTALTAVDAANSDPEESALAAMTQAGFGALRVGTVLDLLLQGQPLLVYQDLYYLGYGLSDVELVQFKLFPFNEQAFVNALGAAVPENDAGGGQGAGVLGGVFVKGLGSI